MKKVVLFLVVMLFTGLGAQAQMAKVNPIPTFDYQMAPGVAAFMENGNAGETREKRDMNVEVSSSSDGITDIFVTVLLVKKNSTETLGPFTVYCNETLTVDLPKGKWGAFVTSSYSVNISVWIENNNRDKY